MTCNRRTVLSALAGGTALAATGSSAAVARQVPRSRGSPVAARQQLPDRETPATLEGTLSTAPVNADGSLLVGTSRGLYVFEEKTIDDGAAPDDSLDAFVPTRPIRAIEPIGDGQAVLLVEDENFPNILLVDLETGSLVWSTGVSQTVYSQLLGQVDRQVGAYDAVALDNGDVAVATGYAVVALDRDSGETVWRLDRDFYVWSVAERDGTVYAGTQSGALVAIDASSGEKTFETDLAEPFADTSRSVWEVAAVDDGIVVTTEDGYLKRVDPDDGSVAWETQVSEVSDSTLQSYYRQIDERPTMAGHAGRSPDANFFNLRLTSVADAGFLVHVRQFDPGGQREFSAELVFVGRDGSVEWRNDSVALASAGNVLYSEAVDPERLFVTAPPAGETQSVTVLDRSSGTESDVLEIPAVTNTRSGGRPDGEGYLAALGDRLVAGSTDGDVVVTDGEDLHWSFPSMRDCRVLRADFTGDGTEDKLVFSRNRVRGRGGVMSRSLLLRSGEDGSVAWSRSLGVDRFFADGGLRNLTTIDGDGPGSDLLAIEQRPPREADEEIRELERDLENLARQYSQKRRELEQLRSQPGDSEAQISQLESELADLESEIADVQSEIDALGGRRVASIVAISGRDGSLLWRFPVVFDEDAIVPELAHPTSVDTIGPNDEFVLAGLDNRIMVLEEQDDEFHYYWRRYGDQSDAWPPVGDHSIEYRTLDGPGDDQRVVAFSPNELAFAVLDVDVGTSVEDVAFSKRAEFDVDGDRILPGSVDVIGDVDGDGYEELRCTVSADDTYTTLLISPGEGRVVERFESEERVRPTVRRTVNPGGDGPGLVAFTGQGDRFTVSVHDASGEIWREQQKLSHLPDREQGYEPAAVVGGGTGLVAVGTSSSRGGAKVDFYDVSTGERVDSLVLAEFDEYVDPEEDELAAALSVERLPDQVAGGTPGVGIVVDVTGNGDHRFFVVDPTGPEVLVSGDTGPASFDTFASTVGLIGSDASLRSFDPSAGVTIDEPGNGSPLELSWQYEDDRDRVALVSVNDRPVAITTDRTTTLSLPAGDHRIEVAATSPAGITVHDGRTVSVQGSSSLDLALYAAAGLSVVALFAVSLVDDLRRRVPA